MERITRERTGEYLKLALQILKERGGECPSNELIEEMKKRLVLSEREKSLNNSGQYRWITNFRFHSIGLVKAGIVEKARGLWILKKQDFDFDSMQPLALLDYVSEAYDKWNQNRTRASDDNVDVLEEVDEPEVLMDVKPDDISFAQLLEGIKTCRIQIPPFQRSFVWNRSDIRYLLDSIYRGYPIGSFIFWKTTRKLPRSRTIGSINLDCMDITEGSEIAYVLDGQQRITSLFAAVMGAYIEDEPYRFLFDLRQKKFTVSVANQQEDEVALENDINEMQISIRLLFSESRADYNRLVRKYPDQYQDLLDSLYDRFSSYRFSVIQVIDKNNASENQSEGVRQVVRMFSRINETGRKLTVVAKMVARCWGEDFDLRESFDELTSKHKLVEKIREETILQVASVILNHRKCRSRDILERTNIRKLESEWDSITDALLLAVDFVHHKLHLKKLDFLPFDALLVPLSYCFYHQRQLSHEQSVFLEQWFWKASLSNRFSSTVESKIEEDCILFDKLLAGEMPQVEYFIDWDSLKSRLIAQRYSLLNAFSKTVLALLANAEPKNITDGRDVALEGAIVGYYKHNFHHIFPTAYLRDHEAANRESFDSLMNIMFIPAITNQSISSAAPATYFANLSEKNNDFEKILSHHFILDWKKSGVLQNDFMTFLDYRATQIVKAFRVRTGLASMSEEYFDSNPTHPIDILENKIRGIIHESLKQSTEGSYWEDYIPQDIRQAVDKKTADELKRHPYKLQELTRDDVRMSYLDIMDYCKIILSNWDIFGSHFGSKGEVERHMVALKNYRNQVKHSREINEIDKRNGEAAVLWLESILL